MADRRNGDRMRYRYGRCLNDNCEKGKSKEVIEVPTRKDFVCPECGKKLDECAPPKKKNNIPLYAGIGVVVVGIIVALVLILKSKGETVVDPKPPVVVEQPKDDSKVDSVKPGIETDTENPGGTEVQEDDTNDSIVEKPTPKPVNYLTNYSLPYGRYTGPSANGVPDGLEGEIVVTKSYSLDLHNGSSLELEKGDNISRCKFKNGKLVSGMLNRQDGTSRTFNIGVN